MVVMGLDSPTGLQTARVFAARGIEVIGIAVDLSHPCARTRSCRRVVPARSDDSAAMVEALFTLANQLEDRAVLVPCTDRAVLGVARHRQELSRHFMTSVPSLPVIETLMDKARFADFAAVHDLPVPTTWIIRSREDAERAAAEISFPCVFKPALKTAAWDANASGKALIAVSSAELLAAYDRHAGWADAFVAQEWIEGDDSDHYTCDCYLAGGESLVTFSTRKIRQWPPVVGQACISVEHSNPVVRDTALDVFRKAGHEGHGYVEMKWDRRSERHVVIEANVGRPTGRSAAAERAGVELLMTMYCDLVGDPLPTERSQHFQGKKWVYIRRDVQACAYLLLNRRTSLGAVLRSWRGHFAFALFSLRDPAPFLRDLIRVFRNLVRHRVRWSGPTPVAGTSPLEVPPTEAQPASGTTGAQSLGIS